MKQKEDSDLYSNYEKKAHQDVYDNVCSVESPEHIRKVHEFNMRKLLEQSKHQVGQMTAEK